MRPIEYYSDYRNIFDYDIISEVIEHVPNSECFVSKAFELAKNKLIITIPNTG